MTTGSETREREVNYGEWTMRASLVWAVVCAPNTADAKQVAEYANVISPTGIASPWEADFKEEPPVPCLEKISHQHWVVRC